MDNDGVLIVGAGAQAKLAVEILVSTGRTPAAVVDTIGQMDPEASWPKHYALPLINVGTALQRTPGEFVTATANPDEKEQLVARFESAGFNLKSVISLAATVASTARIGDGAIVGPGVVIETFASIGRCFAARANAVVEHDSHLGDFVTLAPGATLAGWVHLEDKVSVLTNATLIPSVHVGTGATIGAGAVVLENVSAGSTVAGVPARTLD